MKPIYAKENNRYAVFCDNYVEFLVKFRNSDQLQLLKIKTASDWLSACSYSIGNNSEIMCNEPWVNALLEAAVQDVHYKDIKREFELHHEAGKNWYALTKVSRDALWKALDVAVERFKHRFIVGNVVVLPNTSIGPVFCDQEQELLSVQPL